jgi:tripartite-type tricarboxylate transporter receptor subunit TctC
MRHAYVSLVTLLLGVLAVVSTAPAQPFPSKPLRFILADGAGGPTDLRARQIGARLSEYLGQPVVIDNRPGGNMMIAAEAAAKAPADGYTLFMGNVVTHSLNPWLFRTLPYRPNQDFAPITMVSAGPLILVVNPQVPAHSMAELVAYARAQPGNVHYATLGRGTPTHLAMERLNVQSGVQLVPVVYKSTGTFVQDLIGGHVPVALNFWSIIGPHVKSGKLRALAVLAPRRLEAARDIPTTAEAGFPGIEAHAWQGVFVPAATPKQIIARLHEQIVRALNSPEIRNHIIETGAELGGNTPEEFEAMIRADQAMWKTAIAEAKISAE